MRDRDGRPVLAVNVIEDVTEVKRAELDPALPRRGGRGARLVAGLRGDARRGSPRLAVPQLADWCAVSLPDGHGFLRSVAVAHADPAKTELAREYNERFAPRDRRRHRRRRRSCATGESQVAQRDPRRAARRRRSPIPSSSSSCASIGMRAAMVVPMTARVGRRSGRSASSAPSPAARSPPADLELAEELGRRAGAAVENARLYTERSRIAQTLQMSLLPDALPEIAGLRARRRSTGPAGAESFVGGDFYDAFADRPRAG